MKWLEKILSNWLVPRPETAPMKLGWMERFGWHEPKQPEPLKCTYCGGDKFFEGPSGGGSLNIICANPECRHRFNYTFGYFQLEDLQRVEPDWRQPRES